MKKKLSKRLFVFPLWALGGLLLAAGCATTGATKKTLTAEDVGAPLYYTGNDEPAASGAFVYSEDTTNE
jgi:hypothetical protein